MEKEQRREYLESVIARSELNQTQFAPLLGIARNNLNRMLTNKDRYYPTNQHLAQLKTIELIIEKGLLEKLIKKLSAL